LPTLCERRPAFFDEMALRRAREQQQQVDAGGGQVASQTTGRQQIEFSDRGGTSEDVLHRAVTQPKHARYLLSYPKARECGYSSVQLEGKGPRFECEQSN
jgi:hypothetical protein